MKIIGFYGEQFNSEQFYGEQFNFKIRILAMVHFKRESNLLKLNIVLRLSAIMLYLDWSLFTENYKIRGRKEK